MAAELKVGDTFPTSITSVTENNPGQQVDLAKELGKGKVIVFGVPGAVGRSKHTQPTDGAGEVCCMLVDRPRPSDMWHRSLCCAVL